ncbi:transmembrane 220 family protein [Costertonia aggregata]|uniref:Transmembrane 220 family protein n=1 Tax=Costertonia aggregata TaxID=343403 RepID=A0A7H9ARV6_9FLAO|nr:transmembrane 220 family protein [Costertonia aggregata]QLG46169.1 transmembrane 220 family protein [Costertonia aggregata]
MKTFFKIFSAFFAFFFLWAAYVQYNDPDPYVWMALYIFAAVISILFFLDKLSYKLALVMAVGYLVGAFLNWPDVFQGITIGEGEIENIEKGRESLGLLFCSVILFVYALRLRFTRK